jgi:indolepyruvate decarboxylase
VLVGDGAFQMTGMELSTCVRYGLDPIVIVLNNGGYTTERLILDGGFNDVQPWDYSKLPGLFGGGHAHAVETVGDLDAALAAASVRDGQFSLIEIRLDRNDVSQALVRLGERLKAEAEAAGGRTAGHAAAATAARATRVISSLESRPKK